MSLVCTNENIPTEEWTNTLIKVDKHIQKYDDHRDHFIISSLPFSIHKLKETMQEFISDTFNDQSLFFACDLILEFIVWTKINHNNHLKLYNKSSNTKWNNIKSKYDELLSSEAIIVFDIKHCHYLSIPRVINNKSPFKTIYFYPNSSSHDKQSELHELIATKISTYLPHHFIVSHDWSKRRDFTGTYLLGYLCDNGEVVQGDLLRQQKNKIFVHFNTDAPHFGKKYEWIEVPNERICPPPKNRPKPKPFEMQTYHTPYSGAAGGHNANNNQYGRYSYGGASYRGGNDINSSLFGTDLYGGMGWNTRDTLGGTGAQVASGYFDYETVDDDLQRAIAASLQEAESTQKTQPDIDNENEEEGTDFFEQAINGSRLF